MTCKTLILYYMYTLIIYIISGGFYYEKIFLSIMIFILTFSVAFSEEESYTGQDPDGFFDYIQGRSIIGFNFMPWIGTLGLNLGLDYVISSSLNSEVEKYADKNTSSKFNGIGMSFNYDFTILPYMSIAVDAGFANSSYNFDVIGGGGHLSLDYGIISYAVGFKFFPKRNAPWGFYLYPKIGGTIVDVRMNAQADANELVDNAPVTLPIQSINKTFKAHGMYAALEIGWRIQLFPKLGANWPVQIGIDIALFDIGYYFKPWGASDILNTFGGAGTIPPKYEPLANIRFIPLPRLVFSIKF